LDEKAAHDDWIQRSSARLALYASMLGATLAGQAIGIAVDAAIGVRVLWIPGVFSVALEAFAGARAGAARAGRALTALECMRGSAVYSAGFVAVTLPLGVWTSLSGRSGAAWTLAGVGGFLSWVVVATFVRAALMRAFARRRRA
jgi:hypothetical protein